LIEPQLGENIGTAARAMLNCGLIDLRLVRPRDGWPNRKARAAAAGADSVIDQARLFSTTAEAIADLTHIFATTARHRDMVKPVITPHEAAVRLRTGDARGEACGLIFGRERTGLTNDDSVRAEALITVPLNPRYSSLNLAQAVLLIGYEWYIAADETANETLPLGDGRLATSGEFQEFFDHLDRELETADFYKVDAMRPAMRRNLRNIFQRAGLTDQEVRTLRGVVARLSSKRGGSGR
jgi:tRNA/rRNA methyltransferase